MEGDQISHSRTGLVIEREEAGHKRRLPRERKISWENETNDGENGTREEQSETLFVSPGSDTEKSRPTRPVVHSSLIRPSWMLHGAVRKQKQKQVIKGRICRLMVKERRKILENQENRT